LLKAATKCVDLAIYELSDSQIMSPLERAQARKVAVRVLYNWYSFTPRMQQTDSTLVVQRLTQAGIQWRAALADSCGLTGIKPVLLVRIMGTPAPRLVAVCGFPLL